MGKYITVNGLQESYRGRRFNWKEADMFEHRRAIRRGEIPSSYEMIHQILDAVDPLREGSELFRQSYMKKPKAQKSIDSKVK